MARRLTKESIRKLLAKGLTGWESGKLVLQDFADQSCGKPSFLTNADIAEIKRGLTEGKDIRDYNNLMAMCRGMGRGLMVCGMAWPEACLNISLLSGMLKDANRRNTVKLFTLWGPQVATAKQYQDITAAQREQKLAFEYSLGYVIEERFYAIAPTGTR